MDGNLTNALSVWNASRTAAATAYSVVESDRSYDDAEMSCSVWPFESRMDLYTTLADSIPELSPDALEETTDLQLSEDIPRSEVVDALQREIYQQAKERLEDTGSFDTYDNSAVINNWNTARAAATRVLYWVTVIEPDVVTNRDTEFPSPTETPDVDVTDYTDLLDGYGELLPESPVETVRVLEQLSIEENSYNAYHKTVTEVIYEYGSLTPRAIPDVDEEIVRPDPETEIAEKLIQVFVDHDGLYREIQSEYDVDFPVRDVAMMVTANANGKTRSDRIASVESWVREWYGDPAAVREVNGNRPRPMGM